MILKRYNPEPGPDEDMIFDELDMENDPDLIFSGCNDKDRNQYMIEMADKMLSTCRFQIKWKKIMFVTFPRAGDTIGSCFLRLIPNTDDIHQILDMLGDASVYLEICGQSVCRIPSLRMNFIILEKLEQYGRSKNMGVQVINSSTRSIYNEEELDVQKNQYKHGRLIKNLRYSLDMDPSLTYLDIPLLFDFFNYGRDINLLNLTFTEVRIRFELTEEQTKSTLIQETCYIAPEYYVYYDCRGRKDLVTSEIMIERPIMQCEGFPITMTPSGYFTFTHGGTHIKFIFIELVNLCPDSEMPELLSCEVTHRLISSGRPGPDEQAYYQLDPSYFYVADYDTNIRLYAISPHPDTDMRGWIKVINEFKGTNHDYQDSGDTRTGLKGNILYPPVNIEIFSGLLSTYNPYVKVNIYFYVQNILRTMSGMAGTAFGA